MVWITPDMITNGYYVVSTAKKLHLKISFVLFSRVFGGGTRNHRMRVRGLHFQAQRMRKNGQITKFIAALDTFISWLECDRITPMKPKRIVGHWPYSLLKRA